MNKIDEARKHFDEFYQNKKVELESIEVETSPSGNYKLKIQNHVWRGFNASADFTHVEIWDIHGSAKILEFNTEEFFWHIWIEKEGKEYLVFAEHRGGQSIIEFPTLKFESYFEDANDFIWTEFHPSPDLQKIAIIGCHWACPFEVVIYDFSSPLQLPLTIIFRETLGDDHENFDKWISNNAFSLITESGVKRTVTFNVETL